MASPKQSHKDQRAILERFLQALYPQSRREGGKYMPGPLNRRDAGAVMERLDRAGCPGVLVTQILFAYAQGEDRHRKERREHGRLLRKALEGAIALAPLVSAMLQAHEQPELAADAEMAREKAEWHLGRAKETDAYGIKRLGRQPLELLVLLEECAVCAGTPLTQGELSGLVGAALYAHDPKAKWPKDVKMIESDSLALALNRFRKRNPEFVRRLKEAAPTLLLTCRTSPQGDTK